MYNNSQICIMNIKYIECKYVNIIFLSFIFKQDGTNMSCHCSKHFVKEVFEIFEINTNGCGSSGIYFACGFCSGGS